MAKKFEYQKTIRERHLDLFGHVNNATYLDLYEEARWEFITANGFGVEQIKERQVGPVVLEADIQFKAEITNREVITIHSQFQEMKNSLVMVIDQWMTKGDGKTASRARFTAGLMDLQKRKLIKPTEDWFRAIGVESGDLEDSR